VHARGLLRSTAVPAAFVREEMNACRSQRQVIILDCCYSGAFFGSKSAVGSPVGTEEAFHTGGGFGRVVLTATDATQFTLDGDTVREQSPTSVFTQFLVEGLKTGRADRDGDGRITVDELYAFAYEEVQRVRPQQTPRKWADKQQGDSLVLARAPNTPARPELIPADVIANLDRPERWARVSGVAALVDFLSDSRPGLVRAAREKLEQLCADDSKQVARLASDALAKHFGSVPPVAAIARSAVPDAAAAAPSGARDEVLYTAAAARLGPRHLRDLGRAGGWTFPWRGYGVLASRRVLFHWVRGRGRGCSHAGLQCVASRIPCDRIRSGVCGVLCRGMGRNRNAARVRENTRSRTFWLV
jgi:hypothetical protein